MSTKEKRYQHTIHLPKTFFPMKGGLPSKEPIWLKGWMDENLYGRIRTRSAKQKKKFILHDGPPYANGRIHMGHAFNKILKDIIVKYKTMRVFDAHYVPGWDCHGLPIEHALFAEMGKRKEEVDQVKFRRKARAYAEKYIRIQKEEFIRLGIFGDWDQPYLTMNPKYQAKIAESFLTLYEKGFIEQRLKPVPWCFDCETALADAELEYDNKVSPSVYVAFKAKALGRTENAVLKGWMETGFSFLVWTTTPWTLPANVALAFHPDLKYSLVETSKGNFVFAQSLIPKVEEKLGLKVVSTSETVTGKDLLGISTDHPFIERVSKGVTADYVSSEEGTGIVHIAPGHGEEDYAVGLRNELPILSPVNEKGCFTSEFKEAEGILVHKANKKIIVIMMTQKTLIREEPYQHSYPHCWRCKNPILFRATKQWFLKADHNGLRGNLVKAIQDEIKFTPDFGKNRIGSMVEGRPDWCLSRQRYWGVPIPMIKCQACNQICVKESKEKIVSIFETTSADAWFETPATDFLPDGFKCSCGKQSFEKEMDIIDVWFDSGVSHQAVLKNDSSLSYPADLYLEGSDQHRGWFQTALITGVALDGHSPYKSVLTHGFVVDGEGKKMSKSRGNVVSPQEVLKTYGADVLRLWVAATDYQFDMRLSKEILLRLVEGYRRIRNTFRFLLGNLSDFDYKQDCVPFEQMHSIDKWAFGKCLMLVQTVEKSYDAYLFHHIYRAVQDYLVVDLSSFYLDVLKDRLYTGGKISVRRRSAQTALYFLLRNLVKILAPILPFTCDEVWRSAKVQKGIESVHEADWPGTYPDKMDEDLIRDWQDLIAVRNAVNQKIELKREAKKIRSSLEVGLVIGTTDTRLTKLTSQYKDELREALIISHLELKPDLKGESTSVTLISDGSAHSFEIIIKCADGTKCERCWIFSTRVGESTEHPTLCDRCVEAIKS
jgi:isoleucyl-tRNA synthetase